jgi:hypothetical protein
MAADVVHVVLHAVRRGVQTVTERLIPHRAHFPASTFTSASTIGAGGDTVSYVPSSAIPMVREL